MRGLIRNPDHADDLRADGSEPVVCDLETGEREDVAAAIAGADAVVFAAGAGPGSGAERKLTMDRDGAIKLLAAARSAAVERYVIVSSIGAEDPPDGDDVFASTCGPRRRPTLRWPRATAPGPSCARASSTTSRAPGACG